MKPSVLSLACAILLSSRESVLAQEAIRLLETFPPGYQYQVQCRVRITGELLTPDAKAPLKVEGSSAIDYDERVLSQKRDKGVERTIRQYARMTFERKIADKVQEAALRPEVHRVVLLRHDHLEVPFSPAGPLTYHEIDLIRTDVFTPALQGLLPAKAVRPGDSWVADLAAVKELTDLEKIEAGQIACKLEKVERLLNRNQAKVAIQGSVKGLGEDGPSRHQIEGYLYFDLESNHLAYINIVGTQVMLAPNGQEKGKITGSFVLTRSPTRNAKGLTDDDLRGLTLEPNEDNTLLLFDDPQLGVRFLYPRRWRVAGVKDNKEKQIALDENRPGGSGLLITLESATKLPTGLQYHQEAKNWLAQNKATVHRMDPPRAIAGANVESFGVDADVAKQRVWLDYYVVRQPMLGGATMVARLLPQDFVTLQRDVARIARSLQITKQQ